jgi:RNA polymerase primary sigma factor
MSKSKSSAAAVVSTLDRSGRVESEHVRHASHARTSKLAALAAPSVSEARPAEPELDEDDSAPISAGAILGSEPELETVEEELEPAEPVPASLGSIVPPKATGTRLLDEGSGDTMLARYFREMATHNVMGQEEELRTAIEVETAEIEHWVAIFSFLPSAAAVLASLERDLPTGEEALSLPQLSDMTKLLGKYAKEHGKISRAQEKRWTSLSMGLARAIRLADSDRLWVLHAEEAARRLGRVTGEEEEVVDPNDPESTIPASRAAPQLEMTPAYRKYLELMTITLARSKVAKNKFVKANLRLVVSIARRYNRGRLPLIDLIQEGNIGLMKAVERFDHARGYRFSTYASWWIRHAISRALADKGRAVRIPVHMLDTHNRVARATQAVIARMGRDPTLAELERETGIPQEKLDKVKGSWAETPFSLDRPVGDEDGRKFIDFLQDDSMLSPYENLVSQKWSDEVRRLLGTLTPIESRIIRWRFGLDDEDELTLKEIGDKYNLSRERIRQLQEQALGKIRKHMRE